MSEALSIGDFSRATQLSVKTLRNYHESGLLEPLEVDPQSGYRRYGLQQIPIAQVIRRFRGLDMPLGEIRAVLNAPDVDTRNELIATHLRRLERDLARTQDAVVSLRNLLEGPVDTRGITHRAVQLTRAAAISDVIDMADAARWHQGALGELYATLSSQDIKPESAAGGIFSNELFADERGAATVFVPCASGVTPMGRVRVMTIPAVEIATTVHPGPHEGVDRAYGALATYVTQHALAVAGPIREYYLVDRHDTADSSAWRTEIGWPIFATG
ncbi:MAG TPA: MerR family transcriptional regulator [Pseudolysinimonas sp.]|jgi:DNA-binding transcriptional MerR regulator